MNRRSFLLLRSDRSARVIELSCRQLYMRFLDAQVTSASRDDARDAAAADPWGGEPPAVFDDRSFDDVLHALERGLDDVDVLRIREAEWLACETLGRALEGVLASFKARGGRVVMNS